MATTKVTSKWQRCRPDAFPELNPAFADRIWHLDWKGQPEPRTLYQIVDGKILRLSLAREPDWLEWQDIKGDDVKSDWWECEDVFIDIKVFLDNPHTLVKGQRVSLIRGAGRDKARRYPKQGRVKSLGKGHLVIEIPNRDRVSLQQITHLANGATRFPVTKISSTHDMVTHVVDALNLNAYRNYPEENSTGGVIWAEDLTGSRVLPAAISAFNPQSGRLSANFHYNVNGPTQYSRYFIENLPFLLDAGGEFFYCPKRKKLFVRLPGDQNPNTAHLEAGRHEVILSILNGADIEIENLHFAGINELPIKTASTRFWRGALHNSAIQLSGNTERIRVSSCRFTNLPFGIISFCSNRPQKELLEQIIIENNVFENIGGSAVTLSAISRLRAPVLKTGKTGRLRRVKLTGNEVNLAGARRISLWGFDHGLCLVDAELSEVAYNTTRRTAGSGIIVFAPPFYHQFGKNPQLEVPVQRNSIHHNRVEDSLLSLQDYGGIAYWHGGPAYLYANTSVNPVGYKHTHFRRKPNKHGTCYRSSCFGIGMYADHGYKVYAFDNRIMGKSGDCRSQFYNACGWNEAAGFLNAVFNNDIRNFAIPIRKGMTESNRSRYLGNLLKGAHDAFFRLDAEHVEFDSLAFAGNRLEGDSNVIAAGHALGPKQTDRTLTHWQKRLKGNMAIAHRTGTHLPARSLPEQTQNHQKTRVFVPWGIAYTQGEYHFVPYPKKITRIIDEHLFWNQDWRSRAAARTATPRNHLTGVNIDHSSFIEGGLESWARGVLRLNGRNQHVQAVSTKLFQPRRKKFIAEFYLRVRNAGPLCMKVDATGQGYRIDVLADGNLGIDYRPLPNKHQANRSGNVNLLDDRYHHLLVEIDAHRKQFCRLFVDGTPVPLMPAQGFIENTVDRSNRLHLAFDGKAHLSCDIDFFRFANGTLEESHTDIDELYQWQFDTRASTGA